MLGKMLMEIRQNIQDEDRKEQKIIVAGGRDFNNYKLLSKKLDYFFSSCKPVVVCGEAKGADSLGRKYAEEHHILIMSFPADWSKGKGAGYIRNAQMGAIADGLIAFWDGKSKGTKHMIDVMKEFNKPVRIVKYNV